MKNKTSILLLIILMAVGFAAVSTTLFINGQTSINANQDDFNVYYSDAYVNGVQDKSVITDDTHIVFTTELSTLGEKYVLDYEVTNGSKNYDAELVMECTGDNEYLTVTNEFDTDTILKAKALREGKLTLELTKSNAGEDVEVTITCTINANAVERNTLGVENRSEIGVTAKDENANNLNAKAYEITGSEETKLLDSLVETGYIDVPTDVDALIEVTSDEFDNLATTTFDVSSIASEGDTIVILHFNEETSEWEYISEEVVNENGEVTADFTSYSPVAFIVKKEDSTEVLMYAIGKEINLLGETFNVISQTEDTVTLFAQYNLGTDYKQSVVTNYVSFSKSNGWAYTPGPKEINIQSYDGNAKAYVNAYVSYLRNELKDNTITGNLITLKELEKLGCIIPTNYSSLENTDTRTCSGSIYVDWLLNEQNWVTSSANSVYDAHVWYVTTLGYLGCLNYTGVSGIRPVITISKSALN